MSIEGYNSRRDFLRQAAQGAMGLGLLSSLHGAGLFAQPTRERIRKAKSCIFLFMVGGPSQMDLFDCKPELNRRSGQSIDLEFRRNEMRSQVLLGSQRSFAQYGQTGQWCSDALPELSAHMDKLAIVKSLYTDSFAHSSGLLQMNTGQMVEGFPSLGAWLGYGLGSANQDLPAFVVMQDPRGGPVSGPSNWGSGFMPAAYQGTVFRSVGNPLLDLSPAVGSLRAQMSNAMQAQQLEALLGFNALHEATRPNQSELPARSASYALAFRMQGSAREVLDLASEDTRTRERYCLDRPKGEHRLSVGPAPFGRQCLIARRLVERGVRFVQIYHGGGHQQQTWDAHHGVETNLSIHAPEIDQPIAALLEDLEQRGLLEETLVVWGGEFGRQPTSQQAGANQVANPDGRDHNPKAFTMWLAGAGIRPGSYGETDELGAEAVVNRHHVRDLHATILERMGLDHEQLSFPYGGLDRRLTGVIKARPIRGILS